MGCGGIQARLSQGWGSQAVRLGAGQDEGVDGPGEGGCHPQGFFWNLLLHQLVAQLCGLRTMFHCVTTTKGRMQIPSMQPMVLVINHCCVWPYSIILEILILIMLEQANCVFSDKTDKSQGRGAWNSRLPASYIEPMTSGMLGQVNAGLVQQYTV